MKKLNVVISCVAVSSLMILSGCQTIGGTAAKEDAATAKAESDAALATAQAEIAGIQVQLDVARAEVDAKEVAATEEAAATKVESDATLAASQAETAEVQAQLAVVLTEVEEKEAASQSIPGSTVTQDGNLLFVAEGQSVAKADDGAMGVAKARLAAETIAKANLLEVLKGALISSSVNVGDLMFESQTVSTTVNGWLGGITLETGSTVNEQSRLPNAETVDQIVTSKASLEISEKAWANLQDYVE